MSSRTSADTFARLKRALMIMWPCDQQTLENGAVVARDNWNHDAKLTSCFLCQHNGTVLTVTQRNWQDIYGAYVNEALNGHKHLQDVAKGRFKKKGEVGRCKLDPSLKAHCFQTLNLRVLTLLST